MIFQCIKMILNQPEDVYGFELSETKSLESPFLHSYHVHGAYLVSSIEI